MGSAPEKDTQVPVSVPVTITEFVNLLMRKMADEQINPLQAQINEMQVALAKIETAVLGNGVKGIHARIEDLDKKIDKCFEEHVDIYHYHETKEEDTPEVFMQRVKGGWFLATIVGGVLVGAAIIAATIIAFVQALKGK